MNDETNLDESGVSAGEATLDPAAMGDQLVDQKKGSYGQDNSDDGDTKAKSRSVKFLNEVPLKIKVELGRANANVKDLLQMKKGTVIELSKLAGEPLEILVNGSLVSKGEVVVINDKFGVRLTDIIDPDEGVQKVLKSG